MLSAFTRICPNSALLKCFELIDNAVHTKAREQTEQLSLGAFTPFNTYDVSAIEHYVLPYIH